MGSDGAADGPAALSERIREALGRYSGGETDETRSSLVELLRELEAGLVEKDSEIVEELALARNVISSSTSAIATCDLEGKMTYGNAFFERTWGFEGPEDYLGKPFTNYWLVEDRVDEIIEALNTEGLWCDEVTALKKDGATFDVQVSAAVVFDSRGRPFALTSTSIETTERKQMEETLRESEQRLRLAISTARLTIWDWDIENDRMTWDSPSEDIVDPRTSNETAYEWWVSRVHPEDREAVVSSFADALSGARTSLELEYRFLRTDGTWADVVDHCRIFRTESGEARRVIGALMDVTRLRHAERELRKACDELESRVEERTAELRIRAAQLSRLSSQLTLAEERERKRLAAILHDHLQQLLVAARMSCDALGGKIGWEHREAVQNIARLIAQSIETSRSLTAELSPPALHRGNLSAALKWLARWMEDNHGLSVVLSTPPGVDPKREDISVLLFRSVREMLLNVVKHSGVRCARVELAVDGGKSELRVAVLDEGSGFDAASIGRQGHAGTGFGLLSIRERLGLLGGRLEVESSPGKGACFVMVVPLKPRGGTENEPAGKPTVEPPVSGPAQETIRVLLVDDRTVVRGALSELLGRTSHIQVIGEAADGESAVAMSRELKPDVVLMDITMLKAVYGRQHEPSA